VELIKGAGNAGFDLPHEPGEIAIVPVVFLKQPGVPGLLMEVDDLQDLFLFSLLLTALRIP